MCIYLVVEFLNPLARRTLPYKAGCDIDIPTIVCERETRPSDRDNVSCCESCVLS